MSHARDKAGTPPGQTPAEKPAGRVSHDKSGRAIWEWAVDTGRHALDSTSRLLKRLDVPGLSIEGEKKKSAAPAAPPKTVFGGPAEQDPAAGKRQSFNPYNSSRPPSRAPAPRTVTRTPVRPAAPPAPAPGLFSRLFGAKR